MNKLLPTAITSLLFTIVALVFPLAHAYATPSLTFDQTSVYAPQNATFTVNVLIKLDGDSAWGSKATIQYPSADLDVVSATKGQFFPAYIDPIAVDTNNGLVEITGYSSTSTEYPGSGTFATLTFKSKKNTGSSKLQIACSTDGSDSNILKFAGTNILDCSKTNSVSLTYGSSGTTISPTPGATPTPVPGTTAPTCTSLSADKSSGKGTPFAVTFSCAGVYTNGYINAAYFDFGDGTSDTIVKNVGSPGSVTTTHTYMTVGSLGASCKVRNNDDAWSSVPDACKRIITVSPVQIIRRVVASNIQTYVPPATTPTPQIGTLVFITPTATPSPELVETPVVQVSEGKSGFPWWIVLVGIVFIGGIIYLLGKRSPPPPPPTTAPPVSPPPPVAQ